MYRVTHVVLLLASLSSACALPTGSNPALRCSEELTCGVGLSCYRGFCVEDGLALADASDLDSPPAPGVDGAVPSGPGLVDEADASSDDDGSDTNDAGYKDPHDAQVALDAGPRDAGNHAGSDAGIVNDGERDSGTAKPSPCESVKCCTRGKKPCPDKCDESSGQRNCDECSTPCKDENCEGETCRGES